LLYGLSFAGLGGLPDAAIVRKRFFFNRIRAKKLFPCVANGHLSAKKTILDIRKSKRMLDNDFRGE
jgi:hypothetical protein